MHPRVDSLYIPRDPLLKNRRRWRWQKCKLIGVVALAGWAVVWYFGIIHWAGR